MNSTKNQNQKNHHIRLKKDYMDKILKKSPRIRDIIIKKRLNAGKKERLNILSSFDEENEKELFLQQRTSHLDLVEKIKQQREEKKRLRERINQFFNDSKDPSRKKPNGVLDNNSNKNMREYSFFNKLDKLISADSLDDFENKLKELSKKDNISIKLERLIEKRLNLKNSAKR